MSPRASGVTILNLRHVSRVAAIQTASGPRRLMEEGLPGRVEASGLPVEVVEISGPDDHTLGAVGESFGTADAVARRVRTALSEDRLTFVLSGSCHMGLGSVAGLGQGARGVVWLDAHGDFNTPETTGSGLVDGTTLAAVTGRCWRRLSGGITGFSPVPDENVVLIGAWSLDPDEGELLDQSGVAVIRPESVSTQAPSVLRALGRKTDSVYVHVDLDILDAAVGRANAFAEEGGLSREELLGLVERLMELCPVKVVGLASYDPAVDEDGTVCRMALELAELITRKGGGA